MDLLRKNCREKTAFTKKKEIVEEKFGGLGTIKPFKKLHLCRRAPRL